jgi:ATP-grasp domain
MTDMANLSDALVILKPDVLSGPFAHCDRAVARDTVRGLLSVYTVDDTEPFEIDSSHGAVVWARHNIDRKVRARDWYVDTLREPHLRLPALRALLISSTLAGDRPIATTELVRIVIGALGFRCVVAQRRRCTYRDFLGLYADNTHFTRLAGSLRDYLVDKDIVVEQYEGDQELSSLHIFKEMIRRVVRYPTTHYDAVENLLHVSDPGSRDWEFFAEIVRREDLPMATQPPVVVLCKWRAEMVSALVAAGADVYLVVDRADLARTDFDDSLLAEVRGVYRIGEFDSIEEITAVAADLTVRGVVVDHVMSLSEDAQLGAGHLRLLVGGEDREPLAAAGARDKRLMKHLVGRAGVRVTEWASLLPGQPVDDVGFPAVVKPVYGFGTMNTVRVDSADELGAVVAGLPELPRLKSDHLIVERFVDGRELHIDALWYQGEPLFLLASAYRVPRLAHVEGIGGQHRVHTGDGSYVLDRGQHADLHERLMAMHRSVNKALGITTAVTHLEVFDTPSGELVFSEIACRMGGGWVADIVGVYFGRSIYDTLASGLLTGDVGEPKPPFPHLGVAHLRPARGGTITAMPTDEQLRDTPGVVSWRRMKQVGDPVAFANAMDWCLFVVIGANTEAELHKVTEDIETALVIEAG